MKYTICKIIMQRDLIISKTSPPFINIRDNCKQQHINYMKKIDAFEYIELTNNSMRLLAIDNYNFSLRKIESSLSEELQSCKRSQEIMDHNNILILD